jgi:hypothetical protein
MRRLSRLVVLSLGVAALALAVLAPGASAGIRGDAAPLTILKTVSGTFPAGTTFTATIQCTPADDSEAPEGGIINDGADGTDTATVTFGADGQPTSADTVTFYGPGVCTVTETANGGASSTTYSCVGTLPENDDELEPIDGANAFQELPVVVPVCPSAGPQAAPITVNIEDPDQTATVTIANTYTATTPQPIPAARVVAQPAFTG